MYRETTPAQTHGVRRRIALLLGAALFVVLMSSVAGAAEIKVSTRLDQFNSGEQRCSLREAVEAANKNTNFSGCVRKGDKLNDTIVIGGGKLYELTRAGVDDTNLNGDLDIAGPTRIVVNGQGRATIDGNDHDRVIDITGGLKASRLIVRDGTVTPGQPDNEFSGGGIFVSATGDLTLTNSAVRQNQATTAGGAITSRGHTTLKNVTMTDNVSTDGSGGGVAFFSGNMTIQRSTIADNQARSGGGIEIHDGESFRMFQSTISGNEAVSNSLGGGGVSVTGSDPETVRTITNSTISGNSSWSRGGGIWLFSGDLQLNATTITGNTGDIDGDGSGFIAGSGGGIHGSVEFKNSIVAGNFATNAGAEDCYQASPLGPNLVGDATGCPTGGKTIGRQDPGLRPLGDYGGPTQTHALKSGSPAIGKAGASAPGRDQRGVKRDSNPDLGAFER